MTGKEIASLVDETFRIHRQTSEIVYRRRGLRRALVVREEELAKKKGEYDALQARKREALVDVREKERVAEEVAQSLSRRREQQALAASEREFEALRLQIEIDEKKNDAVADAALEAYATIEVMDEDLLRMENEISSMESEFKTFRETSAQSDAQLQRDLDDARAKLRAAESKLPRDWQSEYFRCVETFGGEKALAPLEAGGYCGACNFQLTFESIARICDGVPVRCTHCGKLLFMPENFPME